MIYEQITIEKELYLKLLADSKELEDSKNKGKCKFYDICPSCSGWCNNSEPSGKCVEFILSAYERLDAWCRIEKELREKENE